LVQPTPVRDFHPIATAHAGRTEKNRLPSERRLFAQVRFRFSIFTFFFITIHA
jgi:hypothetical protein